MSKIIIGIHGIGNKPPKDLLHSWWESAIIEGLTAIKRSDLSFRFELVYWADILHKDPLDPYEKNENHPLYMEEPYLPAAQFTEKKPTPLRKKVLDYLEKQIDKLLLNEDMSINFSAITDKIIHHYFKDLETYYCSTCFSEAQPNTLAKDVIRERLRNVIEKHSGEQIQLICHSMGSIIAYDVLTQVIPDTKISTLVTLGSPLGLPVIMSKIFKEIKQSRRSIKTLSTPQNVTQNWYNISDLQDRVAFNYNLADDFAANSRSVLATDFLVYNNYRWRSQRNPHKSYGYLRTPEVARVITEFVERKDPSWISSIKDKIHYWFKSKLSR